MENKESLEGIKEFLKNLAGLQISETDIPEFRILNWPKEIEVEIKLGKKEFLLPAEDPETKMLIFQKETGMLTFKIKSTGHIIMEISKWYYNKRLILRSYDYCGDAKYDHLNRIGLLILLRQFQNEIFPQVIKKIEEKSLEHNQVMESAKKALEPFIPSIVADKLSWKPKDE